MTKATKIRTMLAMLLALMMIATASYAHYNSVQTSSQINCGQNGQVQFTVYGHPNTAFSFRVRGTNYGGWTYTTSWYAAQTDSGGRYDGITGFYKLVQTQEGWSLKAVDTVFHVEGMNALSVYCK